MSDIQQVAFGAIERIAALRSSDDVLAELRKCGTVFEYEKLLYFRVACAARKGRPLRASPAGRKSGSRITCNLTLSMSTR